MDSNMVMGLAILVITLCALGLVWYLLRPWFDQSAPIKDDPADLSELYAPHIPTWAASKRWYSQQLVRFGERGADGTVFLPESIEMQFVEGGPGGWPPAYTTLVPAQAAPGRPLRPFQAQAVDGLAEYLVWAVDEVEARYGLDVRQWAQGENPPLAGWIIKPFVPQSAIVFKLAKEPEDER